MNLLRKEELTSMSNVKKYKITVVRKSFKELNGVQGQNLHAVREKLRNRIKNEHFPDKWDSVWYEVIKSEEVK